MRAMLPQGANLRNLDAPISMSNVGMSVILPDYFAYTSYYAMIFFVFEPNGSFSGIISSDWSMIFIEF
jgi:hypothetical protein